MAVDEVQRVLQALGSPVRREILWLVGDRERPAGEIAAAMHVSAPTVSEHLKVLRDAGLVAMRVDGSFRRYRARQEALDGLQRLLADTGERWNPADDLPERERASARTATVVVASVELGCSQELAFTALTDPEVYSRWLGVPVQIDGRGLRGHHGVGHPGPRPLRARRRTGSDRHALGLRRRRRPGARPRNSAPTRTSRQRRAAAGSR